jgi:hypothetical protein
MLYIAVYSLSCMTKHSPNYWVLLVGRLLGGIATSLLFSAFEAWVVAEHNSRGYDEKLLGRWRRGGRAGDICLRCWAYACGAAGLVPCAQHVGAWAGCCCAVQAGRQQQVATSVELDSVSRSTSHN